MRSPQCASLFRILQASWLSSMLSFLLLLLLFRPFSPSISFVACFICGKVPYVFRYSIFFLAIFERQNYWDTRKHLLPKHWHENEKETTINGKIHHYVVLFILKWIKYSDIDVITDTEWTKKKIEWAIDLIRLHVLMLQFLQKNISGNVYTPFFFEIPNRKMNRLITSMVSSNWFWLATTEIDRRFDVLMPLPLNNTFVIIILIAWISWSIITTRIYMCMYRLSNISIIMREVSKVTSIDRTGELWWAM